MARIGFTRIVKFNNTSPSALAQSEEEGQLPIVEALAEVLGPSLKIKR